MPRFKTITALASVAALAAAAAPAAADSIAYVKDGDVWLSTPDASRQFQVTKTGTYHYVSQADDGTMIALAPGERLHKLSRTGEVLADFATYVSDGSPQAGPVNQFAGPFAPEISPDGKLVAFEWMNKSYSAGEGCNASTVPPCYVLNSSQGVGITRSDGFTPFGDFGLLTGWIGPQWLSNDKLLRSDPSVGMNEDTVLNVIGPGKGDDEMKRWFWDDKQGLGVREVELSRDGKIAAGIAGMGDEQLRLYRILYDPWTAPAQNLKPWGDPNVPVVEPCTGFGEPEGGRFEGFSLSPDGRGIAYTVGNGVWVAELPDISGGCGPQIGANALKLPGAKHPDWGPADVPAERQSQPEPGPSPTPGPTPSPGPQGTALKVSVSKAKLARALRSGLVVKVRTGGPGAVSAVARRGSAKVASGKGRAGTSGSASVRLRFTRAAARKLRTARVVRLSVTTTFTPAGGAPVKGSTVIQLRR